MHLSHKNTWLRSPTPDRVDRMIFGYVSDQNYVALSGVAAECVHAETREATEVRSSPSGALRAELARGVYLIVLSKEGFGAKWGVYQIGQGEPLQFRLLSDTPMGFMWPKWVRAGEPAEIKVHAAEQYRLSLWRYGLRKEPYGVLSWFDEHGPQAMRQILPDEDFSQSGVRWNTTGYPSPHPQQSMSAPVRSGLYYIWGQTLMGKRFSFPWVVAPAAPREKIAVLANTNTWNVYNAFGGRSNYINPTGLPATPTINARQDLGRYIKNESVWLAKDTEFKPLSFERPELGNDIFDNTPWDDLDASAPIQGRMQCGQAPGEWRLLAWLEQEGFAYDYYADAQLHDGTLNLSTYAVLLVGVHPEYWSCEMYDRVERWVKDGGHLMYLGGNGVNCEVRFSRDGALHCLSHEDLNDNTITGNESRMHRTHKAESALLGVAFTNTGAMTSAPYQVKQASHWIFSGTGLKDGDQFGRKSLHERVPGGASGHETDKLMPSSPTCDLLAKGMNSEDGGADLVLLSLGKGRVFSTGSITWVSSLFPDQQVSRITRNVLEAFLKVEDRLAN